MSAITPQTELRLLKCPIEDDNRNQINFANSTAQYSYFNSLSHITADNFTYQRKDSIIRYPEHIDNIIQYNYVMYQNEAYNNKWFYAFITKMEYINDHMTAISIKTDVYQTWQFDLTFKKCFVEREHVNSDGYGEHTIPENLETGPYKTAYNSDFLDIGESHIVMASNINPSTLDPVGGGIYGGIYSGVSYYVFSSINNLNNALLRMSQGGHLEAITAIFYLPDWLTGYRTATFDSNGVANVPVTSQSTSSTGIAIPLMPTQIDGYTPKNKKLFTSPYVGYLLSNNQGGSITYNIEDFIDDGTHTGTINVVGTVCPGGSIRAIPEKYKLADSLLAGPDNNEYGLTLAKFPICSYAGDVYVNWLTQNALSIGLQTASSVISAGVGIVTENPIAIASSAISIGNTLSEVYKHSMNPISAEGNINSGDVTFSDGKLTFTGYFNTIKAEYAKIIDEYFSSYGYKVNSFKVPNITGRSNWNYIKTIGVNIEGNIPQDDMNEIKAMFNNGITIWHKTNYYLDYSQNNSIV